MPHQSVDKTHWIDPADRIEYYLNYQEQITLSLSTLRNLQEKYYWTKTDVKYLSYEDLKGSLLHWYCRHIMHLPLIRELRALPFYKSYRNLHSLIDFIQPFDNIDSKVRDTRFPLFYGESGSTDDLPLIKKARNINDPNAILYDFRSLRYNPLCQVAERHDLPWNRKSPTVIWRGATTGQTIREKFVKQYAGKYDIGFSTVKQKPHLKEYLKGEISVKEQVKARYLVSLQGNDLASNIRWVLHANSVLIMPKPRWTSWTMEEKLLPNVHYLQLNDDLDNLEELIDWAENHPNESKEIAENGKNYVAQFLEQPYNTKMRMRLLEEFAKRLSVID